MSFASTVARNVFSNATGFFVNILVGLLLTPYVERQLGSEAWGLWAILVACTGSYGLLDLGIRSAVGQYVTRYWAKGDMDGVNRTLSTAFYLLLGTAALLALATPLIAVLADRLIEVETIDPETMRTAFAIVTLGTAANLPLMIFQSAAYARQRFDVGQGVAIAERLIATAAYVWVLERGDGLIGVACVNISVTLGISLARIPIARWLLPGMRISRRLFQRESLRELYGFGVYNVLINAADQAMIHASAFILGVVLSAEAVAHYNAGSILVGYFLGLIASIAWTLTPAATTRDSEGDVEALRSLWLTGSRMILTFAAIVGGGLIFMADDFLGLWMRPIYTDGVDYVSSAWITVVLTFAGLTRAAATTTKQICFGLREVQFLARVSFLEAILSTVFGLVLCINYGILGFAVGVLIATSITQLGLLPRFMARRLEVPLIDFVRTVPGPALVTLLTMGAVWLVVDPLLPVTNWGSFVLQAIALAVPTSVVAFAIGTTADERRRLAQRLRRSRSGN